MKNEFCHNKGSQQANFFVYGKTVRVSGWVRTVRDSKTFGFIELNDGTFFKNLQIVFEEGRLANFREICKLTAGTSIQAEGELVPTPGSKQPFELKATRIEIEGLCAPEYPLQKKRHSFEYLRTIAHLRPPLPIRSPRCFASARLPRLQYTGFFRNEILFMSTLPSLPQRLRRRGRNVPGKHAGFGITSPAANRAALIFPKTFSARKPT